jgi:hypothetical protein
MNHRISSTIVFSTILVLSILTIPTLSLADYDGGEPKKTTTTTQSSTAGTMSGVATPEFGGSIDWILFAAVAALVLLLKRSQAKG